MREEKETPSEVSYQPKFQFVKNWIPSAATEAAATSNAPCAVPASVGADMEGTSRLVPGEKDVLCGRGGASNRQQEW